MSCVSITGPEWLFDEERFLAFGEQLLRQTSFLETKVRGGGLITTVGGSGGGRGCG